MNIRALPRFFVLISLLILMVPLVPASEADSPEAEGRLSLYIEQSGTIFARRGEAVLTDADLDRFAYSVPVEHRAGTLVSSTRLGRIIDNLFGRFDLANRAVAASLHEDERVQAKLIFAVADVLYETYMQHYLDEQTLESYERQAHELYLRDPLRFTRGRRYVTFEQILIAPESGDEIEAMEMVMEVNSRLADEDADFAALATEFSHDPMASENEGRYEGASFDALSEGLQTVLQSLEPGELSGPIRTEFGWHFIRLIDWQKPEKPEFEEVREQYLQAARTRHRERMHDRLLERILDQPIDIREDGVKDFLERHNAVMPENMEIE